METQNYTLRNCRTLKEWCDAKGQPVPDMISRSLVYEALGLGSRTIYVGSAEQNNRLLVELKRAAGLY